MEFRFLAILVTAAFALGSQAQTPLPRTPAPNPISPVNPVRPGSPIRLRSPVQPGNPSNPVTPKPVR